MSDEVIKAAMNYLAEDIYSIPIPARSKAPTDNAWQQLRLSVDELAERFANGSKFVLPSYYHRAGSNAADWS